MPDLYLASQSPRRRELLTQMGVNFGTVPVAVVEQRQPGEAPAEYVVRLAREKAAAGWQTLSANGGTAAPVLGADTIGVCAGEVLEKPRDQAHAAEMLRLMSGRRHQVMTAVALCRGTQVEASLVQTSVLFRPLSDAEIRAYWHTGEPRDKAGGYGIQGKGGVFVERLEGSYSAVVGLPLAQTAELLDRFQIPWWATGSAPSRE